MKRQLKQIIRRSISTKGQICIPADFRPENLDSYMIEKDGEDTNGNAILKLAPITKDDA